MSGKWVVLTGASGFVGGQLLNELLKRGYNIHALVRKPPSSFDDPRVRWWRHILPQSLSRDEEEQIFSVSPEAFIHCGYDTSLPVSKSFEVNIEGASRLIELARRWGVRQFTFISSLSAHESALSSYGRSKFAIEKMLDPAKDLIVRPGLVVGKGGLFLRMIKFVSVTRLLPLFFGGNQPIQVVGVDELAQGVVQAIDQNKSGVLVLAHNDSIPISEFYRELSKQLRANPVLFRLPGNLVLAVLRLYEKLGLPALPLNSENLLGLKAMIYQPSHVVLRPAVQTIAKAIQDVATSEQVVGPPSLHTPSKKA